MKNGGDKTGNFVPGVGEKEDQNGHPWSWKGGSYFISPGFGSQHSYGSSQSSVTSWGIHLPLLFSVDAAGLWRAGTYRHNTHTQKIKNKGLAACWPQKQMTDKASWQSGRDFSLELENPLQATPSSPPDTTLPQVSTSFLAPESWKPPYIFWNRRFPFQGTPKELLP